MRGSPGSEDRGPIVRAVAGVRPPPLLGPALRTSPILLPFTLAPLMLTLRGTPFGAAILERLHLVYIGLVVCCPAALATACLAFHSAPDEALSREPARRPL